MKMAIEDVWMLSLREGMRKWDRINYGMMIS